MFKSLEEALNKQPEIPMGRVSIKPGDKFGRLTLICRVNYPSDRAHFLFKCDCGNYSITSTNQVKSGKTQSCGCYQSEVSSKVLHDLKIGKPAKNRQIFQYLEEVGNYGFKYLDEDHVEGKVRYCKFLCPLCQQEYIGRLSNVKQNLVRSCGCNIKESFGVKAIKNILNKENIKYDLEFTFPDCKNIKLLPFDFHFFYKEEEILIEFDGSQHFYPKWGEKELNEVKARDKIKNEFCLQNKIKLYRIPYSDETKLNNLEDLLNPKYLIN